MGRRSGEACPAHSQEGRLELSAQDLGLWLFSQMEADTEQQVLTSTKAGGDEKVPLPRALAKAEGSRAL